MPGAHLDATSTQPMGKGPSLRSRPTMECRFWRRMTVRLAQLTMSSSSSFIFKVSSSSSFADGI